jgi:hypothetical protein
MRKYLFWLLFSGSSGLYAQVLAQPHPAQQSTNIQGLHKLAENLRQQYQINHQKALNFARRHHWPILKTYSNGRTIALQGLDERGMPVYYATENNSIAAATTRTNQLYGSGSLGLQLSGNLPAVSGKLGIWDDGAPRVSHQELTGRVNQMDASSQVMTHSTHVAGTLVASGVNPAARGMAFASQLKAWSFNNDIAEMTQAAPDLLVSNHSYGTLSGWDLDSDLPGDDNNAKWRWYGDPNVNALEDYKFGFYGEQTKQWDQMAYNAPFYLPVKSAGNNRGSNGPTVGTTYRLGSGSNTSSEPRNTQDGYDLIATMGTAKNILTVGAVHPIPNGYRFPTDVRIADFSSWGPTDDGRIKPDIVGDGVGLLSSTSGSDNSYASLSGTSMSTPNVSGTLLLLQELHASLNNGRLMKASTLKGLVLHTADEAGSDPGPDYVYGWGLLNAETAARTLMNTDGNHLVSERNLNQGESYTLTIPASGKGPLVATLCWTDPEGTALPAMAANLNNRSPRLVNDLDLRISDGNSPTLPWILNPDNPSQAANRGDNIRDNVEQVLVENTVAGKTYTLTITHKGTIQRGPQAYSLILSGVGSAGYCTSAANTLTGARINNVTFGTQPAGSINYTSPTGCTTYSDLTNISAQVEVDQETKIPLSVSLGSCTGNTDKIAKVFIDWNGDKDFNDANELVATSGIINGNGTFNAQVSVPADLTVNRFTRLRVVCVATNNPVQVNSCGSYSNGETQDYSIQFIYRKADVGIVGLVSPENSFCSSQNQKVSLIVRNYGSSPQSNIPLRAVITNAQGTQTTLQGIYTGSLSASDEAVVSLNGTFEALPGQQYTILGSTHLAGDLKSSNNALGFNRTVSAPNQVPIATATRCGTAPVTLKGEGNGTIFWYDAASGGHLLAAGNTVTTSSMPANEKIYAAFNDFSGSIGVPNKNTFPNGGYNQFSPAVLFTTQVPLLIKSSRLYIGHSGKIIVSVQEMDGSVVSSTVLEVRATRNPAVEGSSPDDPADEGAVYDLNLKVPAPGNYQLVVSYENGATLLRNNEVANAGYPFEIPGVMAITGNTATTTPNASAINFYYYFYDLRIQSAGCPSPRVAVTLSQQPELNTTITAIGKTTLCNGDLVLLQAEGGPELSYQWKRNGQAISNASGHQYWAGETGNYSAEISQGNCLVSSNLITVTSFQTPIISVNASTLTSSQAQGNQWFLNGAPISGATQSSFTATRSGRYSVRASQSGCPDLLSNEVNLVVTALEAIPIGEELRLYPNPVTDRLTIVYAPVSSSDQVSILIYNTLGQVVLNQNIAKESGFFSSEINLSRYSAGLFLVRLTDGKKTVIKAIEKL